MVTQGVLELRPLAKILANLREWDNKEIFATLDRRDPFDLAEKILYCPNLQGAIFSVDGDPVAAVGARPLWPGVAAVWAFGTDRFSEVGLSATKYVVRCLRPRLLLQGFHRAECKSMEGHAEAHRWLEAVGMHREATHPKYGRDGETFHTYAYVRGDDTP